jgi:hypothetical protein
VKSEHNREKTLRQPGERLEWQMLGPFMYVFFILPVEVGYCVISYFSDKRVGVGRTAEEEFFS